MQMLHPMQTKVLSRAFPPAWAVVSPYYQAGWGVKQTTMTLKAFILGFTPNATGIIVDLESSDSTIRANITVPFTITYSDTDATIKAGVESAVSARCTGFFGIQAPDIFVWDFTTPTDLLAAIPPAPLSYQTIVTQTGTAVPAVSGSLAPTSTYPAGTTFAWARTGVGVYTLTASTAVFNTSGKTGVFVAPLQNLNGSIRAVVTSTTVITVTTAVQSLAVLGLLGFTATNTDALLNQTMLYVQTYA